jgi:SAM-dependent methyltransferase
MITLDPIVVCPETLGPLEARGDALWSSQAQRSYPVHEDLVFLGYPQRDAAMIKDTMAEEHEWQGTAETVERDLAFLQESAPRAVELINLASRHVTSGDGRPRALELGAGSGWVSWLLAVAGYDTWMVDFEANSLAIGLQYQHKNLPEGRRFVGDARYAPFADGSFDLVLLKEFVHHVSDYDLLFAEVNRVLCPGGILALMEPTRSVLQTLIEKRRPDPHQGHVITWVDVYRRALKRNGFALEHETAAYSPRENKHALVGRLKSRASRSVTDFGRPDLFSSAYLRLVGDASSVIIGRKVTSAARAGRPPMTIIDPATLVITDVERDDFRAMIPVLEHSARGLDPVVPEPAVDD